MAPLSSSDVLDGASEATEFGAAIRDMRLAHGTDLATVASTLRIRLVYLQAIEDGRFSDLPGPTYAAGFVRAYAEYLGLDISEVMRRYREVALGSDRQAPLVAPSPVSEGTMPTGFILLVAAVLAAIAYGSWYYLTLHGRDAGDIVAKIPRQIAEIVGMETDTPETPETSAMPATPDAAPEPTIEEAQDTAAEQPAPAAEPAAPVEPQEPAEAVSESPAAAEPERATADTPEVTEAGPPAEPAGVAALPVTNPPETTPVTETAGDTAATASEAAAETQQAPTASVEPATAGEQPTARFDTVETTTLPPPASPVPVTDAGVPEAAQSAALPGTSPGVSDPALPSRVVLRANAISWVELRDSSGKRVFSRLLKKGETYNVPGDGGIRLATGNAGALDVLVDGQTIGPLGPVGAVRRGVLMEPAALLRRSNARR